MNQLLTGSESELTREIGGSEKQRQTRENERPRRTEEKSRLSVLAALHVVSTIILTSQEVNCGKK